MRSLGFSNIFKLVSIVIGISFYLFIAVREQNLFFVFPLVLFFLIIAIDKKNKNNISFLFFLLFYGFFSRLFYFLTTGYAYNLIFLIPFLYIIFFLNEIFISFLNLTKELKIFFLLHFIIIIYMIILPLKTNIFDFFVLVNLYILPFFFFLNFKNFSPVFNRFLIYFFPLTIFYGLLQYFNIYLLSDIYYVKNVSFYQYTSLKLGNYYRPFSTFSSVEEFSCFLVLSFVVFLKNKTKFSILFSLISFFLIILFSFRTAMFVAILMFFVFLLFKKMYKVFFILFLLFLILSEFLFIFVKIDTTIYKDDNRLETILKHNVEPFIRNFETYSLKNRIQKVKNDMFSFKRKPFGVGLYLSSKALDKNIDKNKYETSFLNLFFSGGFVFILYFVFSILILFRRINIFTIFYILLFIFSSLFNFHFILPVILKVLFEEYDGYQID
ncbi:MAG: hypothetical protein ABIN39_03895 [candidate division WOR-3 bacterium]